MLDVTLDDNIEFDSRRKQTARIAYALHTLSKLEPAFTIHLGDLVQTFPENPDFHVAIQRALDQFRLYGIQTYHLPGNHDIGDKPDPTMPTHPVSQASLSYYHQTIGKSWQSFDRQNCHFILLNSQIMNSNCSAAKKQRKWLEQDLKSNRSQRIFVFTHLPPYLMLPDEPGLGHYDNISQPDRTWLLNLLANFQVELLVSGHVHYCFFDHIQRTRFYTAPSPSFTRPGFGHLFCSEPPPDQGRDDQNKLGFYLFRVMSRYVDAHFIGTDGKVDLRVSPTSDESIVRKQQSFQKQDSSPLAETSALEKIGLRVITRTSRGLPNSPLGITLESPLAGITNVPLTWPSAIRQPIRNDYPILKLQEIGCRYVRTPFTDLLDPVQNRRLQILRTEGIQVIATCLWNPQHNLPAQLSTLDKQIDGLEIQILLSQHFNQILKSLFTIQSLPVDLPLTLCPLVVGEIQEGKQHGRTRIGFLHHELPDLNEQLLQADLYINRVCCSVPAEMSPWKLIQLLRAPVACTHIKNIDLLLRLDSLDDLNLSSRLAESLFALLLLPNTRLFVEPLIDLDRTMDITHGLLDTCCNPRTPFHLIRCLNSLLFSKEIDPTQISIESTSHDDFVSMTIQHFATEFTLLLPDTNIWFAPNEKNASHPHRHANDRLFDLCQGTVYDFFKDNRKHGSNSIELTGPALRIREIL